MALRRPISFPTLLIAGSLGLVLIVALLVRFSPPSQRMGSKRMMRVVEPTTSPTSTSSANDIAVAISGDLLNSIPPSWTFVQKIDEPMGMQSPLNGLTPTRVLLIKSLETSQAVRIVEYAVADLVAFKKDIGEKKYEEFRIGRVIVRAHTSTQDKGTDAVLIEGTTKVIILSPDEGSSWPSVTDLPPEIRDFAQSLRVQ